jgi:transcriptional antiterminator RfaH
MCGAAFSAHRLTAARSRARGTIEKASSKPYLLSVPTTQEPALAIAIGFRRSNMAHWICARTEPMRESAAQHFLGLNGFTSYCPRIRVVRRHHGRRIETKPVLFPSYLFIWVTGGWWAARWSPGIVGLLTNGGAEPARVPSQIIDSLRQRERGGLIELPKQGFKVGDKVMVRAGPFTNHHALFQGQRPHQRVEVLLQLLGSVQKVELPRDAVEVISS